MRCRQASYSSRRLVWLRSSICTGLPRWQCSLAAQDKPWRCISHCLPNWDDNLRIMVDRGRIPKLGDKLPLYWSSYFPPSSAPLSRLYGCTLIRTPPQVVVVRKMCKKSDILPGVQIFTLQVLALHRNIYTCLTTCRWILMLCSEHRLLPFGHHFSPQLLCGRPQSFELLFLHFGIAPHDRLGVLGASGQIEYLAPVQEEGLRNRGHLEGLLDIYQGLLHKPDISLQTFTPIQLVIVDAPSRQHVSSKPRPDDFGIGRIGLCRSDRRASDAEAEDQ